MNRISVIVPACNAEDTIERCLGALLAGGTAEFIVVNDGSTDNTGALLERYPVRRIDRTVRGGPAKARNEGASLSNGDVLVFIDSDIEVYPDTVERIRRAFDECPEMDALMGSYDDCPDSRSAVSRFRNLLHHDVHQQARRQAKTFWGGCGAIRRTTFLALGGMDEAYTEASIEDIEFGYRLHRSGRRCEMRKDILVKHLKNWTLTDMVRTDLFARAIPWTRLMYRYDLFVPDLNFSAIHQVNAVLVVGFLGSSFLAAFTRWGWLGASVFIFAFLFVNRRFFRLLLDKGGTVFVLKSVPLFGLHYLLSVLGFGLGTLAFLFVDRPRKG